MMIFKKNKRVEGGLGLPSDAVNDNRANCCNAVYDCHADIADAGYDGAHGCWL